MTAEINIDCLGRTYVINIDNDGNLSIPGYKPKEDKSACFFLLECWDYVLKCLEDEGAIDTFLENVIKGIEYWPESYGRFSSFSPHPEHKDFDAELLVDTLASALKYYIKKEDPIPAIAIASAIKGMPFEDWIKEPQILVDGYEEETPDGLGIGRSETHKISINEIDITEWEEKTAIRAGDPFLSYIDKEDYRRDHGFDDLGPTEIDIDVLEALGLEEEMPSYPNEEDLGIPEQDPIGPYGLLYERKDVSPGDQFRFEVIAYASERELDDATWMANRINDEIGEDYKITAVRRLAPSELLEIAPIEDQHPLKRVNDWTELEKNWADRPEDFD